MGPSGRLDSWKAIAAYLHRDESTVRRWEKEGLPIHRHMHNKKAAIYAYTSEIDVWWNDDRRTRPERVSAVTAGDRVAWWLAERLMLLAAALAWVAGRISDHVLDRPATGEIPRRRPLP